MKNLTLKFSFALVALFALAGLADAQVALVQTTLSSAVTTTSQRVIQVASATGITAPSFTAGTSTQLYIDDEVLDVTSVSGTLVTVRRGANGTKARMHNAGVNVYVASVGSGAFIDYSLAGYCPAGTYPATPMIDYFDAETFQCVNGQWAVQTISGQQHFPNILIQTAVFTNATTTFAGVPALTFPVSANHTYTGTCQVVFQGSATTAGPKFEITGPASPTAVLFSVDGGTGAAAYADSATLAFGASLASLGTLGATATNYVAHLNFSVQNGVNSGTVSLLAAANGAGTLTIQPGSYCIQQ